MNPLLLIIIAFSMFMFSEAAKTKEFRCFRCESLLDGKCADGFHATGVEVVNCTGSCVKIIHHINVEDIDSTGYSRYCREEKAHEGCSRSDEFYNEKTVHVEVTKCYCDTDLCNSHSVISSSRLSLIFAMVLWKVRVYV